MCYCTWAAIHRSISSGGERSRRDTHPERDHIVIRDMERYAVQFQKDETGKNTNSLIAVKKRVIRYQTEA